MWKLCCVSSYFCSIFKNERQETYKQQQQNRETNKMCIMVLVNVQRRNPKVNHSSDKTRRFSNHVSRMLSRSHTFAIIVILDLKIHQSMWIHWPVFPKTWTKGHWPLDDLWPHVCWGHMCDSTQGSLCPSPMTIHHCMWIQWSILQNTTYIHTPTRLWCQAWTMFFCYPTEDTQVWLSPANRGQNGRFFM